MLLSLLGYMLLGLLLGALLTRPLWRLLRWLGPRSGLYPLQWRYLRPYVPLAQRGASPTAGPSPPTARQTHSASAQESA